MPTFPFGQTVTVHTRTKTGTPDSRGNDVFTDVPTDVAGCVIWPRGGPAENDTNTGDQVFTGLYLLTPPGTAVNSLSRVTVNTVLYEVVGEPAVYTSPLTGLNPGVLVSLERVTG